MKTDSDKEGTLFDQKVHDAKKFAEIVFETIQESLIILDSSLKVISANRSFYQTFQVNPDQTVGRYIYDLGNGQWNIPELRKLLEDILPKKNTFDNFELEHNFETIGQKIMRLNARRIDDMGLILLVFEDITLIKKADIDRKITDAAIIESEGRYRNLFIASRDAIMTLEPPSWRYTSGNPATITMFGAKNEGEFLTYYPWDVSPEYQPDGKKSIHKAKEMIEKAMNEGSVFFEWMHKRISGEDFFADVLLSRIEINKKIFLQAVIRDISRRKKTEKLMEDRLRLVASNTMFQQVIEAIPVRIFWKDKNLVYLGCNTLFAHDAGKRSSDECIGKNDYEMGWKNEAELYRKDDSQVIASQKPKINYEEPQTTPTGKQTWLRTSKIPLRDQNNEVIGILGTYEDITERKKIEEKLRVSEEKYRILIEYMNDGVFIIQDERIQFFNDAFAQLAGYSVKEIIGKKFSEFVAPSYRNLVSERYFQRLKGAPLPKDYEIQLLRKDGAIIDVIISVGTITFEGKAASMGILKDITERKRKEEKIIEEKLKNEAILDSIGDAVFACDKDGKIVLFNNMAENLTGMNAEVAFGQHYSHALKFVKEKDESISEDFIEEAMKKNRITKMKNHVLLVKKDGTKIPVADSAAPIKNINGEIIGCVVVFHDMRKERQIDKAKTEFVSLASHQLRTPLAAISWNSELLLSPESGVLNTKQRQYAEETYQASKKMVNLVNALLNVSRIELGTFVVEPELINLIEIAKNCIDVLKPKIVTKKIIIDESYTLAHPTYQADPKLLSIIIENLISNAVKYSSPGATIRMKIGNDEEDILITVADTGIGIPENQKEKMFTKLFRADNAQKIDTDGSGLGLYMVSEILKTTGGTIWFESTEGRGTTFFVKLPKNGMMKKGGVRKLI